MQSLPLTVSTSWKLGNPVTGVPAWEKTVNSPEADNGIVACQALIQAPAEVFEFMIDFVRKFEEK